MSENFTHIINSLNLLALKNNNKMGISAIMPQLKSPNNLNDDLISFIFANYSKNLPNSLLIAQAFILKYPQYGKEYGLPTINRAIEDCINADLYSIENKVKESKVQSGLKIERIKHIYEKKMFEDQKHKR